MSTTLRFPDGGTLQVPHDLCRKCVGIALEQFANPEWGEKVADIPINIRSGFEKLISLHNGVYDVLKDYDLYDALDYIGFGPDIRHVHADMMKLATVYTSDKSLFNRISPYFIKDSASIDTYMTISTSILKTIVSTEEEEITGILKEIEDLSKNSQGIQAIQEINKLASKLLEKSKLIERDQKSLTFSLSMCQALVGASISRARPIFIDENAYKKDVYPSLLAQYKSLASFSSTLLPISIITCYSYQTEDSLPFWSEAPIQDLDLNNEFRFNAFSQTVAINAIADMWGQRPDNNYYDSDEEDEITDGYKRIKKNTIPSFLKHNHICGSDAVPRILSDSHLTEILDTHPDYASYLKIIMLGGYPCYVEILGKVIQLPHGKWNDLGLLGFVRWAGKFPRLMANDSFREQLTTCNKTAQCKWYVSEAPFLDPDRFAAWSGDPYGSWCYQKYASMSYSEMPEAIRDGYFNDGLHPQDSNLNLDEQLFFGKCKSYWENEEEREKLLSFLPIVLSSLEKGDYTAVILERDPEKDKELRELIPEFRRPIVTVLNGLINPL